MRSQVTSAIVSMQAADVKNIMDGYPCWSPSWKLLPNTYESAHEFWGDLFRAAFPHTKKLLDKEVNLHDTTLHPLETLENICRA